MLTDDQARQYLFEIIRESEILEDCWNRFQRAAAKWLESHYAQEKSGTLAWQGTAAEREMMGAVEGILSAFARISLFFFPESRSKAFGSERAERLRELVGIDENHPLGNRELRNDWMHLDERIDREVQAGRGIPVGYMFQLPHQLTPATVDRTFRLVDPGGGAVHILGRSFPLRKLVDAVAHVNQQAVLALAGRDEESSPKPSATDAR